jgi:hypothetical protein
MIPGVAGVDPDQLLAEPDDLVLSGRLLAHIDHLRA